ncbi:unnamed protein product [Vicia faba]|uniref:Uncharacterized protein n=1 Tax=Vicia faba TaxID=3906 RepID=A0AAV0ZDF1_VICFA|nr:unnamed protein product [Vicia faba]
MRNNTVTPCSHLLSQTEPLRSLFSASNPSNSHEGFPSPHLLFSHCSDYSSSTSSSNHQHHTSSPLHHSFILSHKVCSQSNIITIGAWMMINEGSILTNQSSSNAVLTEMVRRILGEILQRFSVNEDDDV